MNIQDERQKLLETIRETYGIKNDQILSKLTEGKKIDELRDIAAIDMRARMNPKQGEFAQSVLKLSQSDSPSSNKENSPTKIKSAQRKERNLDSELPSRGYKK